MVFSSLENSFLLILTLYFLFKVKWKEFISVIKKEVRREVDNPTIVPLLLEQLDSVTIDRMFEGFPPA